MFGNETDGMCQFSGDNGVFVDARNSNARFELCGEIDHFGLEIYGVSEVIECFNERDA